MKNFEIYRTDEDKATLWMYEYDYHVGVREGVTMSEIEDIVELARYPLIIKIDDRKANKYNKVTDIPGILIARINEYINFNEVEIYPREMTKRMQDEIPDNMQQEDELILAVPLKWVSSMKEIWEAAWWRLVADKAGMTKKEVDAYDVLSVAVIMADGKTKIQAFKALIKGSDVFTVDIWVKWYSQMSDITLEEIKAGKIKGMKYVIWNNTEYIIKYKGLT